MQRAQFGVVCQGCGNNYETASYYHKWCPDCRPAQVQKRFAESEKRHRHPCPDCGTAIARCSVRCRPCGTKIRIPKVTGPGNYAWKGGRTTDRYGYIHLLVAPEARKGHRYRPEHRLVWEAANGPIPEGFIIHHRNGVKDDNRLENLEAMPRKKHNHRHEEHDKRILELEEEVRLLRARLGE